MRKKIIFIDIDGPLAWDSINNSPLEYNFGLKNVKDPFALLKYLADVIYDWDIITNK